MFAASSESDSSDFSPREGRQARVGPEDARVPCRSTREHHRREHRPPPGLSARLRTLGLRRNPVGDAGMQSLAGLTKLRSLELMGTKITDAGLARLAPLRELRSLDLSYTDIGDAGLTVVRQFPRLRELRFKRRRSPTPASPPSPRWPNSSARPVDEPRRTTPGLVHLGGLKTLKTLLSYTGGRGRPGFARRPDRPHHARPVRHQDPRAETRPPGEPRGTAARPESRPRLRAGPLKGMAKPAPSS